MSQRRQKDLLARVRRSLDGAGIRPGSSILVALSGGPDSVALLHALAELREAHRYRLSAAHLNHALRGEESDRDEGFCRDLCARLAINLIAEKSRELAPRMANLEEAARCVRHDFLRRAASEVGADYVALGHHADDQAETVLMRLLRGAGVAGLGAMAEMGPGRVIRPMLSLSRRDILAYLDSIGAAFVDDSSNRSTAILRNRVRRDLLPALERDYVPGASRRLAALAAEMQSVDAFLSRAASEELSAIANAEGSLNLSRFAQLDTALRMPLLRLYLTSQIGDLRRINRQHLEGLAALCLSGPVNGEISLPNGRRAVREYDHLRIQESRSAPGPRYCVPISFEGTTEIPEAGFAFDAKVVGAGQVLMPSDHNSAIFDLQTLVASGLTARSFESGDRIHPLGMAGRRKVKDVFIDRKLPRAERKRFPIVAVGNDIVWLPGLVRGEGALIEKASETALQLKARRIA